MNIGNFQWQSEHKMCGSINTLLFSHQRVVIRRVDDIEGKRPSRFQILSWADDGTATEIGIGYPLSEGSEELVVLLAGPGCEGFIAELRFVCEDDDAMGLEWEPARDIEERG